MGASGTANGYTKGLHEIGDGVFAYLQPDGSWGWSNAGLVTDGETSLLVDTLFDLKLTGEMLTAMKAATPAAAEINTLVNTHANGDHCFGNQLVADADIIASKQSAEEMQELPPAMVAKLTKVARITNRLGILGRGLTGLLGVAGLEQIAAVGGAAEFIDEIFGAFELDGITLTPPTKTFAGTMEVVLGDKVARLIEVGPAHTRGDVLVHVPADRVVFCGDILFIGGHPIMWQGPVENWIDACEQILAMDVDKIIPGHGPLTDRAGVERLIGYWKYLRGEARARYDVNMPLDAAIDDIDLSAYDDWTESERIVVNVEALYRQFGGDTSPRDTVRMFGRMAKYRARNK